MIQKPLGFAVNFRANVNSGGRIGHTCFEVWQTLKHQLLYDRAVETTNCMVVQGIPFVEYIDMTIMRSFIRGAFNTLST